MPVGKKLNQDTLARAIEMRTEGITLSDISKITGLSKTSICRHAKSVWQLENGKICFICRVPNPPSGFFSKGTRRNNGSLICSRYCNDCAPVFNERLRVAKLYKPMAPKVPKPEAEVVQPSKLSPQTILQSVEPSYA